MASGSSKRRNNNTGFTGAVANGFAKQTNPGCTHEFPLPGEIQDQVDNLNTSHPLTKCFEKHTEKDIVYNAVF